MGGLPSKKKKVQATPNQQIPAVIVTGVDRDACVRYVTQLGTAYRVPVIELPEGAKKAKPVSWSRGKRQRAKHSASPKNSRVDDEGVDDVASVVPGVTVTASGTLRIHFRYVPEHCLSEVLERGLTSYRGEQGKERYSVRGLQVVVPLFNNVKESETFVNAYKEVVNNRLVQEKLSKSVLLIFDATINRNKGNNAPRRTSQEQLEMACKSWGAEQYLTHEDTARAIVNRAEEKISSSVEKDVPIQRVRTVDNYSLRSATRRHMDMIRASIMRDVMANYFPSG
eukprot:m.15700 g.15700  ORF g.15700 m.15700 type:complete len:282 (-) comp5473_c0_seq1:392-1237(-)